MTWIKKYIKAEWQDADIISYCNDCHTQVDTFINDDGGEKACQTCGGTNLLSTDEKVKGVCSECMEEDYDIPDGDCVYCRGDGTMMYGEDVENVGPKTLDELFEKIKNVFGETDRMNCVGWILPDGAMINTCYGGTRDRGIDHRDVSAYMGDFKEGAEDSTDAMNRFIELGAIRAKPLTGEAAVQIGKIPTADQIDAVERFFEAFPGPYGIQFGFNNKDYIRVDEYWEVGHELRKKYWAGYAERELPAITTADMEAIMTKYAISLPRGYYDGLKYTLEAWRGSFSTAIRNVIKVGGDSQDAADAVEDVVYGQIAKLMGFGDVEVVEAFGDGSNVSVTVFNPQTDDATEMIISMNTGEVFLSDVPFEIDVDPTIIMKAASIDKSAIEVKKIVRQRKYKHGYIIKDEYWAISQEDPEDEWTLMERMAYTPCGEYIGDSKTAYYICKVKGIIPRLASPDHSVCSIGYNPVEKKWYGWSHRAMCGYGMGDMIFEENYGDENTSFRSHGKTKIETMEDAMASAIAFAASVS